MVCIIKSRRWDNGTSPMEAMSWVQCASMEVSSSFSVAIISTACLASSCRASSESLAWSFSARSLCLSRSSSASLYARAGEEGGVTGDTWDVVR